MDWGWYIQGGDYTWTAGDLAGLTYTTNDLLIYTAGGWIVNASNLTAGDFYTKAESDVLYNEKLGTADTAVNSDRLGAQLPSYYAAQTALDTVDTNVGINTTAITNKADVNGNANNLFSAADPIADQNVVTKIFLQNYAVSGTGDMLASVYDTNASGVVDNSELVNGLSVDTAVPVSALFTDTVYDASATLVDSDTLSPVDVDNKLVTEGDMTDLSALFMTKTVYDTNANGVVDNSEKVNGLTVNTAVPVGALFTDTVYNDTAIQADVDSKMVKDNAVLTGSFTEEVYAWSDATLNPAHGTIQTKTVTGDEAWVDSVTDGQSLLVHLTNGGFTITYPTIVWVGSDEPTLTTVDAIVFYKIGTTLYGKYLGEVA